MSCTTWWDPFIPIVCLGAVVYLVAQYHLDLIVLHFQSRHTSFISILPSLLEYQMIQVIPIPTTSVAYNGPYFDVRRLFNRLIGPLCKTIQYRSTPCEPVCNIRIDAVPVAYVKHGRMTVLRGTFQNGAD